MFKVGLNMPLFSGWDVREWRLLQPAERRSVVNPTQLNDLGSLYVILEEK